MIESDQNLKMSLPNEPIQIDLSTRVKRCEDQMAADLGGELAILNIKTGTYYGLNEIGSQIWLLLKESRTVKEIRDRLLEQYEVEPSRCEQDLVALLIQLAQHDLVQIDHAFDHQI